MNDNAMRKIRISKVVINIGTGSDEQMHGSAKRRIEAITNKKPANSLSRKRNPSFKIVKGQKIGAFVTIRGNEAKKLLSRLFDAVNNKIKYSSITNNSLSFGIAEYIDINGIKYDPKIGMLGMDVNVSFKRNGLRVALRKIRNSSIPERHRIIPKEEILEYINKEFGVTTIEAS